jgi:hypothetical protein
VASREALHEAGGFDENLQRCEDFDMWLRLSLGGGRIGYHSDAEVFHREHDASLSSDGLAMYLDRLRVYEKTATLSVTGQQRGIISSMVRKTHAECYLGQLKEALARGDYAEALEAADLAYEAERSWKLKLAVFGLRLAPGLFVNLDRIRLKFLRMRDYERGILRTKVPGGKDSPAANA